MSRINNLEYKEGRLGCGWVFAETNYFLSSENPLVAVPFNGADRILVVEPASDKAPHNAIIIDGSGNEIARVQNPEATNGAICFSDAYYVNDELTLVIAFSSFQMACVVNAQGNTEKLRESR